MILDYVYLNEANFRLDSSELSPFSCHFPLSSTSFILIDYMLNYQTWQQDEEWIEKKILP